MRNRNKHDQVSQGGARALVACALSASMALSGLAAPNMALASDSGGESTPTGDEGSQSDTTALDFSDVTDKTPHAEDIEWMVENEITTGFPDGTFRPYAATARCDMAAFIFRLAKHWDYVTDEWEPTYEQKQTFKDVDENTPHAREIWWMASESLTTGWVDSEGVRTFRPYAATVRCDMAAFLFRLAVAAQKGGAVIGYVPTDEAKARFRDVTETPDRHARDIWWMYDAGVAEGWMIKDGVYEFRGLQTIARCDTAAFLHRLDEIA